MGYKLDFNQNCHVKNDVPSAWMAIVGNNLCTSHDSGNVADEMCGHWVFSTVH